MSSSLRMRQSKSDSRWFISALMLGVLLVLASIWSIVLQNRVNSLETQIHTMRASAQASAYILQPTDSAPKNMSGQIFLGLSGSGVVVTSHLPPAGDNEEFMIWFLRDGGDPVSGGTLTTTSTNQGFALIAADAGDYDEIAISLEPAGATTPGGVFLLMADVQSGKG